MIAGLRSSRRSDPSVMTEDQKNASPNEGTSSRNRGNKRGRHSLAELPKNKEPVELIRGLPWPKQPKLSSGNASQGQATTGCATTSHEQTLTIYQQAEVGQPSTSGNWTVPPPTTHAPLSTAANGAAAADRRAPAMTLNNASTLLEYLWQQSLNNKNRAACIGVPPKRWRTSSSQRTPVGLCLHRDSRPPCLLLPLMPMLLSSIPWPRLSTTRST